MTPPPAKSITRFCLSNNMTKEFKYEHAIKRISEYSGREFEIDMLGDIRHTPEYDQELKNILSEKSIAVARVVHEGVEIPQAERPALRGAVNEILENKYALFDLVKKHQRFDPTNPNKDFLRELRLAVIDSLGIESEKDMEKVKVYTSVASPLDTVGFDGFITYEERGEEHMVTLDATLDKKKFETRDSRADVVFTELPDSKENEAAYLSQIEELAEQAIHVMGLRRAA